MADKFIHNLKHESNVFFVSSTDLEDLLKEYDLVPEFWSFDAYMESANDVYYKFAALPESIDTSTKVGTVEEFGIDQVIWNLAKRNIIPCGIYMVEVSW